MSEIRNENTVETSISTFTSCEFSDVFFCFGIVGLQYLVPGWIIVFKKINNPKSGRYLGYRIRSYPTSHTGKRSFYWPLGDDKNSIGCSCREFSRNFFSCFVSSFEIRSRNPSRSRDRKFESFKFRSIRAQDSCMRSGHRSVKIEYRCSS